jgi:hypothetical protein
MGALAIRSRGAAGAALVLAILVVAWSACAADLTIADFVGRFSGEAHSEADDRFFVATLRDIEVDLEREGDGFRLAWSTLIYDDAGTPRRRDNLLHFLPAAKPGQFRTAETLEPFSGRPAAWAYVAGSALTVDLMAIHADGTYELQTYVRELTGDVMTLRFVRIAPGRLDLVVVGRLTRRPAKEGG